MIVNYEIFKLKTNDLLERIDQEYVVSHYLNICVKLKETIKSPVRLDPKPGCIFNYDHNRHLILFDYSRGKSYNVISLVAEKLGVEYFVAKEEIIKTFLLGNFEKKEIQVTERIKAAISAKTRSYNKTDLEFWKLNDVIVKYSDLIQHRIFPITSYIINNVSFLPSGNAYLFNGENYSQIYRPDLNKDGIGLEGRYRSDTILGIHGLEFCDASKTLIITKSRRDCFYLQMLGINACFVLSENHIFTQQELTTLSCFPKIILLYDNDATGRLKAFEKKELHGFSTIFYEEQKDTVDNIEFFGKEKTKIYLDEKINL